MDQFIGGLMVWAGFAAMPIVLWWAWIEVRDKKESER